MLYDKGGVADNSGEKFSSRQWDELVRATVALFNTLVRATVALFITLVRAYLYKTSFGLQMRSFPKSASGRCTFSGLFHLKPLNLANVLITSYQNYSM